MYFFLWNNYSNKIVFDKTLALLNQLKKLNTIAKIRKGAIFWKQPLDNILFKMSYFSSIFPLALVNLGPLQLLVSKVNS